MMMIKSRDVVSRHNLYRSSRNKVTLFLTLTWRTDGLLEQGQTPAEWYTSRSFLDVDLGGLVGDIQRRLTAHRGGLAGRTVHPQTADYDDVRHGHNGDWQKEQNDGDQGVVELASDRVGQRTTGWHRHAGRRVVIRFNSQRQRLTHVPSVATPDNNGYQHHHHHHVCMLELQFDKKL